MYKTLTASFLGVLLTGCATTLSNFEKSTFSGVTKNKVAVVLPDYDSEFQNAGEPIATFINDDPQLKKLIASECRTPPVKAMIAPAVIPIATALGKLAFDLYMDKQMRAAEDLKKAAQTSYSGSVILSDGSLANKNCALIARYSSESDPQNMPGLIALVKLVKEGDSAIVVSPRYIKATNSAAVTRKSDGSAPEEINLSFAVSTKTIGKQQSGLNGLFAVGEGVFSVARVQIGPKGKSYVCPDASAPNPTAKACPTSDLVAYPSVGGPVSITFAVTETGRIGVDVDQSIAELKAVKEAMGPALKDSLKEYFK